MKASASLGLIGLLTVAAGSAGGCGTSNQEACQAFVDSANEHYRACGYDHLVLDQPDDPPTCPASLNVSGADCVDYYRCLQRTSVCCTPEHQNTPSGQGCELGTIDFVAMNACSGCQ